MKILQVTYTTKAEFAEQNKANIQQVMSEVQALHNAGIRYSVCVDADGKTFTHTAFFASEAGQKLLQALPSFVHFQEQLKQSVPEIPPAPKPLTLVGASYSIF